MYNHIRLYRVSCGDITEVYSRIDFAIAYGFMFSRLYNKSVSIKSI